jgi:hypothetical protein
MYNLNSLSAWRVYKKNIQSFCEFKVWSGDVEIGRKATPPKKATSASLDNGLAQDPLHQVMLTSKPHQLELGNDDDGGIRLCAILIERNSVYGIYLLGIGLHWLSLAIGRKINLKTPFTVRGTKSVNLTSTGFALIEYKIAAGKPLRIPLRALFLGFDNELLSRMHSSRSEVYKPGS